MVQSLYLGGGPETQANIWIVESAVPVRKSSKFAANVGKKPGRGEGEASGQEPRSLSRPVYVVPSGQVRAMSSPLRVDVTVCPFTSNVNSFSAALLNVKHGCPFAPVTAKSKSGLELRGMRKLIVDPPG
jgi:hypothetical protein